MEGLVNLALGTCSPTPSSSPREPRACSNLALRNTCMGEEVYLKRVVVNVLWSSGALLPSQASGFHWRGWDPRWQTPAITLRTKQAWWFAQMQLAKVMLEHLGPAWVVWSQPMQAASQLRSILIYVPFVWVSILRCHLSPWISSKTQSLKHN